MRGSSHGNNNKSNSGPNLFMINKFCRGMSVSQSVSQLVGEMTKPRPGGPAGRHLTLLCDHKRPNQERDRCLTSQGNHGHCQIGSDTKPA